MIAGLDGQPARSDPTPTGSRRARTAILTFLAAGSFLTPGCGGDGQVLFDPGSDVAGSAGSAGAGGTAGSGGTSGSGGTAGTGGTSGSGGTAGTGGTSGSGGTVGTGGTSGSGGTGATGGGPAHKVVFVTSAVYSGNLVGLDGADAKCASLAASASLPGVFKAWLSDDTMDAADRLSHASVPYVLVDGSVVAENWWQLVAHNLLHAIDLTEAGGAPQINDSSCEAAVASVWTGSNWHGEHQPHQTCLDWMSDSPLDKGTTGDANTVSSWWTNKCSSANCDRIAALYCIEQ